MDLNGQACDIANPQPCVCPDLGHPCNSRVVDRCECGKLLVKLKLGCRWLRTLLGYAISPVALLALLLTLVGAVVVLRGVNRKLLGQSEVLLAELKEWRKAHRLQSSNVHSETVF